MNRNEYLKWAKERAIKIANEQGGIEAWSSLVSDLTNHDELKDHVGIGLGLGVLMMSNFEKNETIKFIEGFN